VAAEPWLGVEALGAVRPRCQQLGAAEAAAACLQQRRALSWPWRGSGFWRCRRSSWGQWC